MIPPIESYVQANADCVVIFEDRVQPFGYAFQGVKKPYATWQLVAGEPNNTLSCLPKIDSYRIQFDVWAPNVREAVKAAKALRDAVETHGYVTSWNMSGYDPQVGLYRYSFDGEFLIER